MDKLAICIPTSTSVSAKLFSQWIDLSAWCALREIPILTISNRTHNDARNWLATAGGGFKNPKEIFTKIDAFIWIDSDQVFNPTQLEILINSKEKFVTGWYMKGETPMVARWNEKTFLQTGYMDFLKEEELTNSKKDLIDIDYCGFGFTKTHKDVFSDLTYPYFTNKIVQIGKYTENVSEDASFCLDAGIKPKVIPSLRVGHLKEMVI